jgi:hypothetical protein
MGVSFDQLCELVSGFASGDRVLSRVKVPNGVLMGRGQPARHRDVGPNAHIPLGPEHVSVQALTGKAHKSHHH